MCDLCDSSSGSGAGSASPLSVSLGEYGNSEALAVQGSDWQRSPAADAKLALVLLGTQAGPPIEADRAGISTALVVDGRTYLIDCGRASATQYVRSGLKLSSLSAMFLTHLHADHVADYYNFFLLGGHIPNSQKDGLAGPVQVYGPGPAGGLPPTFGGGEAPTIAPTHPTPGTADMTARAHEAYAYTENVFLRDMHIRDIRTLTDVREIAVPDVGASHTNTAPDMAPFTVMKDDRVEVTATLVPHGPMYPSFAFRFDTEFGSVTFSGDTAESANLIRLAQGTDVLVHEAINVQGSSLPPAVLDHMLKSHVEVQEVGRIAQRSQAKELVLTHISDLVRTPIDHELWAKWASQDFDGRVVVGDDLQHLILA